MKDYPALGMPEIVVAGKSNVGKSSFINALANTNKLARVSSTPGKTRTINFYIINDAFALVDLPGYGYAEVSKAEKESWAGFIEAYLSTSKNIVLFLILVDIRHDPAENDMIMVQYAKDKGFPLLICATKSDKISKSETYKRVSSLQKKLGLGANDIVSLSSKTKEGVQSIITRMHGSIQSSRIAE